MNKEQCLSLAVSLLVVVFIYAESAHAFGSPPTSGPRIKNAQGVEFVVVDGNREMLTRYRAKRSAADHYVQKIVAATNQMLSMDTLPSGPALPAQSRKINALKQEGEMFGSFVGPDASYLHHCYASGIAVHTLWNTLAGFIRYETPHQALVELNKNITECLSQIENPPSARVTLIGPATHSSPPFQGCQEIIDLAKKDAGYKQWGCPAAVANS